LASHKVAFRIAQCKKPHTIAEELILPSAIDIVSTLIGESVENQLKNIPLSNNTISRRIQDNINDQLIDKLRNKNFAIQLDEATDNNKDAYLIYYVRFMNGVDIIEELLFCVYRWSSSYVWSVRWTSGFNSTKSSRNDMDSLSYSSRGFSVTKYKLLFKIVYLK